MNKKTHSITENKSVKKPRRAGLEKGRGRMRSKGRQINASAHNDVRRLLGGRKRRRDLLLEHLHLVQDYYGCLSLDHLAALASGSERVQRSRQASLFALEGDQLLARQRFSVATDQFGFVVERVERTEASTAEDHHHLAGPGVKWACLAA